MTLQQALILQYAINCAKTQNLFPCSLMDVIDHLIKEQEGFLRRPLCEFDKKIVNTTIASLQAIKKELKDE